MPIRRQLALGSADFGTWPKLFPNSIRDLKGGKD